MQFRSEFFNVFIPTNFTSRIVVFASSPVDRPPTPRAHSHFHYFPGNSVWSKLMW